MRERVHITVRPQHVRLACHICSPACSRRRQPLSSCRSRRQRSVACARENVRVLTCCPPRASRFLNRCECTRSAACCSVGLLVYCWYKVRHEISGSEAPANRRTIPDFRGGALKKHASFQCLDCCSGSSHNNCLKAAVFVACSLLGCDKS